MPSESTGFQVRSASSWPLPFTLWVLTMLIPVSVLAIPSSQSLYGSELEAVKAATDLYNPRSIGQDREYMGTIYRSGDFFSYTVFSNAPGADRFSFRVPAEHLESIVAFWHTHGDASPLHQYFSQYDTRMVRQFNKPLYLADFTGVLKIFRPESRILPAFTAQRYGLPRLRGYALGEVVHDSQAEPVNVATGRDADVSLRSYC